MPSNRSHSRSLHGVLALSLHEAEWLDYDDEGNPRYASVAVEGSGAASLVSAALQVRQLARGSAKEVVVALREGLVHQRMVELPKLGSRELQKVMGRKAAQACKGSESPPLYSCVKHAGSCEDATSRWTLTAMDRSLVSDLLLGLRRNGLRSKRVTAVGLAVLDRVAELHVDDEAGVICVAVGSKSCTISLMSGDDLHCVEVLQGNLLEAPQLVALLLQSVKTNAGFWRKVQRGSRVSEVVVMGLNPDRGSLLRNALSSALPDAEVRCLPAALEAGGPHGEDQPVHPKLGRIAMLEACLIDGPFSPRLTFPLPMRRRNTVTALAASLMGSLAIVGLVNNEVGSRVSLMQADITTSQRVSSELRELERMHSRAREEAAHITMSLERAEALELAGVDYAGLMAKLLSALGGHASLLSLNVGRENEGGRELSLRAVATGSAVEAIGGISALERALEALPELHDVKVDLPTRVAAQTDQVKLEFSIRALYGGAP